MAVVGTFTKQPAEVQDYVLDFSSWLSALSDTGLSHTVLADTGITINSSTLVNSNSVKVWVAGGTDGVTYKITVTLTTVAGRVKQSEFKIKVKEY